MKKWLKNSIFTAIGGILVLAIQGIIQNRADGIFLFLVSWIGHSINENVAPWIVTIVFLIGCLGESFYFWQHDKVLNQAIRRANKMIDLDGSLLRNLASWIPS